MSTTTTTRVHKSEESDIMGVASLSSNKRRLESAEVGDGEYIAPKVAKKAIELLESAAEAQDTIIGIENSSSDFLTTSILARTLLTSTSVMSQCSPLESLSSTLEALPAPLMDGTDEIRSTFLPFKTTIHEATELEFTSLLCHERPLSTVTVLSPIDDDNDWTPSSRTAVPANPTLSSSSAGKTNKSCNSSCLSPVLGDQVITEDETGKSYFNLGSADTTLLVKKNPTPLSSLTSSVEAVTANLNNINNNNNNIAPPMSTNNTPPPQSPDHVNHSAMALVPPGIDQTWTTNNCNNNPDFHDDGSSSSCESISSEDLFTSEEFDASEDEEEIRSYKQQRSTVLHLSLCKLNSFRTQQCVEPSLHRSVLICNTLRHIEQEIRNEDEVPLRSHQPLPPFWGAPQHNLNNNNNSNNNNSSPNGPLASNVNNGPPMNNQPQITDIRPNPSSSHVGSLHGHDPYLSPNLYSNGIDSPYISYDYGNSLRPNPTPFHTASYDYEQDLPLVSGSPSTAQILDVSSPPSLLDCGDSGYAEDLNLSPYNYYSTNNSPQRNGLGSHSLTNCDQNGSSNSNNPSVVNGGPPEPGPPSYLNCGYNNLALQDNSVVGSNPPSQQQPPTCNGVPDTLLSDSSLLPNPASDMSDIEMHNSLSLSPPVERTSNNCDYLLGNSNSVSNNNHNNSCNNSSSSMDDSSSSSSENSLSPPPPSILDGSLTNTTSTTTSITTTANNNIINNNSASNNSSSLCWSKLSSVSSSHVVTLGMSNCSSSNNNSIINNKNEVVQLLTPLNNSTNAPHPTFVQQESHQCGMESRLSEFSRSHSNFTNPHHHNLPMDSLISPNYSNSL